MNITRVPQTLAGTLVALSLGVIFPGAAATLNGQDNADPRMGAWDELKTSSHYDSLLRVFQGLDNGMIRMQVNAKLLKPNRWHVDFRCDGGQYRTVTEDGAFVGVLYSCRRTGARTIESSFIYEEPDAGAGPRLSPTNRTSGKWMEVVSADGRSYRTTGETTLTNGQVQKEHREFVRRD